MCDGDESSLCDDIKLTATKPSWISHENRVIYCIDFHPDGNRFASGGADSRVKVWNTLPVVDEDAEDDEDIPKLLSTLTVHNGAVNCVRWSRSGHLLASCGDDRTVLLWQLSVDVTTSVSTPFGLDSQPCIDQYRCCANLVGHTADVQDLAWSPDACRLASCSIDNSIIIWNTATFQKVIVLSAHTNWVKGLAWDPINQFIASQSADGTMVVWRCSDWKVEKVFKKPFMEKGFVSNYTSDMNRQIVFHRPHWSPDGNCLVGSYAYAKVFISPVYTRGTWKSYVKFVGHQKPTTVIKFCPTLFTTASEDSVNDDNDDDESKHFACCAIGAMDNCITIWTTISSKPSLVLRHFFTQSVLDLAWSPDGLSLLACSHDGSVAFYRFNREAFGGRPLPSRRQHHAIQKSHGDVMASSGRPLLVSADALRLEREAEERRGTSSFASHSHSLTLPHTTTTTQLNNTVTSTQSVQQQQSEIKGIDGRRRIKPVLSGKQSTQQIFTATSSTLHNTSSKSVPAFPSTTSSSSHPTQHPTIPSSSSSSSHTQSHTQSHTHTPLQAAAIQTHFVCSIDEERSHRRVFDAYLHDEDITSHTILEVAVKTEATSFTSSSSHSLLSVSRGKKILWSSLIVGSVTCATATCVCIACATYDASLYILSASGRRLLPPIVLSSSPVSMSSREHCVLIITDDANVCVYDANNQSLLMQASMMPLLHLSNNNNNNNNTTHTPSILSSTIDVNRCAIITMSPNAFVYAYNNTLRSWIRIADNHFIASEMHSSLSTATTADSSSRNNKVSSTSHSQLASQLFYMTDEERALCTLAHIEHEIASSLSMNSDNEFCRWSHVYVKQLVSYSSGALHFVEARLKEFCLYLAGPLDDVSVNDEKRISQRELLRNLIPILGSSRSLQSLTAMLMEYTHHHTFTQQ